MASSRVRGRGRISSLSRIGKNTHPQNNKFALFYHSVTFNGHLFGMGTIKGQDRTKVVIDTIIHCLKRVNSSFWVRGEFLSEC